MQWSQGQWSQGKGGKGQGKSTAPPINFNIPGIQNASIDKLPYDGVAVFQGDPSQAVDFCQKLQEALEPYSEGECKFENIDVSKVLWEPIGFSVLLDTIKDKAVTTKRFKAFKCGIGDDSIEEVAAWLSMLPPESLPQEIHLSHNQLTARGFETIFSAIEAKRHKNTFGNPVWLRVENNQIDVDYVNDLERQGRIFYCQDIKESRLRRQSTAAVAMPQLQISGQSAPLAPMPPSGPPPHQSAAAAALRHAAAAAQRSATTQPQRYATPPSGPPPQRYATPPPGPPPQQHTVVQRFAAASATHAQIWKARAAGGTSTAGAAMARAAGGTSLLEQRKLALAAKARPAAPSGKKPLTPFQLRQRARKEVEAEMEAEAAAAKAGEGSMQDESEEMRVHPSDKAKIPYSYAGFLNFSKGDDVKAKGMWDESRPVEEKQETTNLQDDKPWAELYEDQEGNEENDVGWEDELEDNSSWQQKASLDEDQEGNEEDDVGWEEQLEDNNSWQHEASAAPATPPEEQQPATPPEAMQEHGESAWVECSEPEHEPVRAPQKRGSDFLVPASKAPPVGRIAGSQAPSLAERLAAARATSAKRARTDVGAPSATGAPATVAPQRQQTIAAAAASRPPQAASATACRPAAASAGLFVPKAVAAQRQAAAPAQPQPPFAEVQLKKQPKAVAAQPRPQIAAAQTRPQTAAAESRPQTYTPQPQAVAAHPRPVAPHPQVAAPGARLLQLQHQTRPQAAAAQPRPQANATPPQQQASTAPARPQAALVIRQQAAQPKLQVAQVQQRQQTAPQAVSVAPPKQQAAPKAVQKPVEKKKVLPPGWEASFSEEYKIPFYWHADREESSWTFPIK